MRNHGTTRETDGGDTKRPDQRDATSLKDTIVVGDALRILRAQPTASVHCIVTSPPYWGLRDYGVRGQLGLEASPEAYTARLVEVFREARRLLRDDGTLWLNLGDTYATRASGRLGHTSGLKPKDLVGIPWRVALALQADGWLLRADIVWAKPNALPESVTDRPTRSHEYVFLLAKRQRYFYDQHTIREPVTGRAHSRGRGVTPKSAPARSGIRANTSFHSVVTQPVASRNTRSVVTFPARKPYRSGNKRRRQKVPTRINKSRGYSIPWEDGDNHRNRRSVWHIPTQPFPEAHFATFPEKLVELCIRAGSSERGCCVACGAPRQRRVRRRRMLDGKPCPSGGWERDQAGRLGPQGVGHWRYSTESTSVGWRPTCECRTTAVEPCVVLDPFAGSGTTLVVAKELGRHYVGIDLNREYVRMARRRLGRVVQPGGRVAIGRV